MADATILVVDDNEPKRYAIARYLRAAGYFVHEVATGRACLEALRSLAIDVIVLDLRLPDIDGYEVCREVKKNPKTSPVRVLHCSATFTSSADRARGLDAGSDAYLIEPFDPQELVAQVGALVRVRRAEEAQAFLAAIVECSEDAIVSRNLSGTILSWNEAAERLFGYAAQDMIGASVNRVVPPEMQQEEIALAERLHNGESIRHYETVRLGKGGKRIDVALTLSPIRDASKNVIGVSKVIRDISDRIRMERELQEANLRLQETNRELERRVHERTARLAQSLAEMEAFSYSLSHDLRAPLRAISSLTRLVEEEFGEQIGPEGEARLRRVIAAAGRMNRLITDVLAFTRLSRNEVHLHPVDTNLLIQGIISEHPELHLPDADVQVQQPLVPVIANEASLTQCVVNLLGNAVKYVEPGVKPQIRILTEPGERGTVRLVVADNGLGIPPEAHEKVFGLFYRYHASGFEGTGLGLAIARKAAERMGARIGVESDLGKGSRFWIELQPATAPVPV